MIHYSAAVVDISLLSATCLQPEGNPRTASVPQITAIIRSTRAWLAAAYFTHTLHTAPPGHPVSVHGPCGPIATAQDQHVGQSLRHSPSHQANTLDTHNHTSPPQHGGRSKRLSLTRATRLPSLRDARHHPPHAHSRMLLPSGNQSHATPGTAHAVCRFTQLLLHSHGNPRDSSRRRKGTVQRWCWPR